MKEFSVKVVFLVKADSETEAKKQLVSTIARAFRVLEVESENFLKAPVIPWVFNTLEE